MSGKGDKRRNENTAAVEANWPTCWDARDRDDVCKVHGNQVSLGQAIGAEQVQSPVPNAATEVRG